jgi:Zn-dependent protease with chaperone function
VKLATRSLLALGLLAGAYLLIVGLVACLAFGVRAAVGAWGGGYGAFRLLVLVLLLAAAAAWSLVAATLRRSAPVTGVRLSRQAQPRLWALVDQVAAAVRTRAPDELVLVEDANAAVLEEARLLRTSHRVMVVGAPLLMTFDVARLTAVLAHELGHYSGRHTALDRLTFRGQEMLVRMIWRLGPRSLLGRLLTVCTGGYVAVAAVVSRGYEFEADEYAAELAGSRATADAVQQVPQVAAAWHHYRRADVLRAEDAGRRPARMFEVFGGLWAIGERRSRAAADAIRWAPESSLYDTHPPTEDRVERLLARDLPGRGLAEDGEAPAHTLLDSPGETLARLEDLLYEGRGLVPTPWEELVADHGRERARGAAEQLGWAAEQEGFTEHADLAALLEIVEDGRGTTLSGRYMDRGAPETSRRLVLVDLLTRTVENALIECGALRHVPGPDGEPVLLDADGTPLPVRDLVSAAVRDPAEVEPLRRWAGRRGLLRVHRTLSR